MRSSTAIARRLFATRPSWGMLTDVTIAAVVLAASLALLRHGGVDPTRPGSGNADLIGVVLVVCTAVPLVVCRRFPLGALVVSTAAGALLAGLGYPADLVPGPAVALYLLAASRTPQAPWTRHTTGTVVVLFMAYLIAAAAARTAFPVYELSHTGLAWAVAWFAGERTRLRREQLADLKQRAVRVERDAERERLLAIAEERARIARDLHDSAGHAINVIAVRAGAARLRHHQDPDRSLGALEAVEELARHTAEEIDKIVGTLRRGTATDCVEAPASLASLDTLIARHTSAGLTVKLDVSGTPRPLSATADQAAYRILQEALTNAARHGAGSARIQVAFDDTAVGLTVTNPVRSRGAPRAGGGHGLIGMRERATLLGGALNTERVNGAFLVHAQLPDGSPRS